MKTLKCPEPVKLTEGQTYTFESFLDELVWEQLRKVNFELFDSASNKVDNPQLVGNGAYHIAFTDEEHEAIWKILQSVQLPAGMARKLKPFLKAFARAISST